MAGGVAAWLVARRGGGVAGGAGNGVAATIRTLRTVFEVFNTSNPRPSVRIFACTVRIGMCLATKLIVEQLRETELSRIA